MYDYNNYSGLEFDEMTIRWSALNSEVAAARARQKQYRRPANVMSAAQDVMLNLFQHLKNNACAAICSAAAIIFVFCW